MRKWLPQGDLLQLEDVAVVMTHCGWGGLMECVTAGKPILAVPVFADQPINAIIAQQKGIAVILQPRKPSPTIETELVIPKFTHE